MDKLNMNPIVVAIRMLLTFIAFWAVYPMFSLSVVFYNTYLIAMETLAAMTSKEWWLSRS